MATTSINIRMDSDLKNQFEAFCQDMGMSMSTAINIFAKKTVREYRIPFEVGAERPNAETIAAIEEGRRLAADPNAPRYSNMSELREALGV